MNQHSIAEQCVSLLVAILLQFILDSFVSSIIPCWSLSPSRRGFSFLICRNCCVNLIFNIIFSTLDEYSSELRKHIWGFFITVLRAAAQDFAGSQVFGESCAVGSHWNEWHGLNYTQSFELVLAFLLRSPGSQGETGAPTTIPVFEESRRGTAHRTTNSTQYKLSKHTDKLSFISAYQLAPK